MRHKKGSLEYKKNDDSQPCSYASKKTIGYHNTDHQCAALTHYKFISCIYALDKQFF